jgi:endoglucanase
MKSQKNVFSLLLLILLLVSAGRSRAATPWLHVEGNQIKDPNGNVVILRGVSLIDLGDQQSFYDGVLTAINRVTNRNDNQGSSPGWYPKVIRLPIVPGPNRTLTWQPGSDTFYNTLLRPAVNLCRTKDVYCIIDLHHIADTNSVDDAYVRGFWQYMASRFANDSHVIFEIFNEPINTSAGNDTQKWASVRSRMQTWVNIVRAAAPRNLILVGTPQWCQILTPVINNPITGGNIVYVSHIYPGHWGSQFLRDQVSVTASVFPIFMTEWGFRQNDAAELLRGTISSYGLPLDNFRETFNINHTAWVVSTNWGPPMFDANWLLRVGEGEMGGFTKDRLYALRNFDQPSDGTPTPTPTPSPSPGGTPQTGVFYRIVNRNSGQSLDVSGNALTNGANVLQWPATAGQNQQWTLTSVATGFFRITVRHSGQALDVAGVSTANGADITQWPATNGTNQQWSLSATDSGYFRVIARHSGKCMEVVGGSSANGADVRQNACTGSAQQQWRFQTP